jgi:hypothetical protein
MTKTKIKKDGINITIENNLFSKNKTSENKEQDDDIGKGSGLPPSYTPSNPFEAEPAFLGEIRNHMAEKRFYNMRINPVRPSYNDMNMVHQNFLNEKENVSQEFNKPMDNDDRMSEIPTFEEPNKDILFDKDGNYKGDPQKKKANEARRRIYLEFKVEPLAKTAKKFGLPDDFLDNWKEKQYRFQNSN